MKPTVAFTLALASLLVGSGALWAETPAAGPTRQHVTIEQPIAAPPDRVWEIIDDFQDMGWHPAVTKTTGEGGNAPRATRVLTLGAGGQIVEQLQRYDPDARVFSYRIEKVDPKVLPVTNYASSLRVTPAPDGGSIVIWEGSFERGDPSANPPPGLTDEAAVKAVTGVYQAGLTSLKSLAEK